VQAANATRRNAGLAEFSCGIGLHLGRVYYGNIGTPERLEFSVIGAAANKAARIEALCKETGQDVVLSSAFVAGLGAPCRSLGRFALRGVEEAEEVFALA
jgi:adenylate cyclase